MKKNKFIKLLKDIWHFIWVEDSFASWVVNIILAFVLIKFVVYPTMGLIFGTKFPIVAVVSSSMEHDQKFDVWWGIHEKFYLEKNITKEQFSNFRFKNGFNKGDLMVLFGSTAEKIKVGDVIVYKAGKPDPIIHRVVQKNKKDNLIIFQTKGDRNLAQIKESWLDETYIPENQVIGKAVLRIPYLGWVKIMFVDMLKLIGIVTN
ncbi:MAG: signal peptidase I [Candidatus Woesearchaeota archaeon]